MMHRNAPAPRFFYYGLYLSSTFTEVYNLFCQIFDSDAPRSIRTNTQGFSNFYSIISGARGCKEEITSE